MAHAVALAATAAHDKAGLGVAHDLTRVAVEAKCPRDCLHQKLVFPPNYGSFPLGLHGLKSA